MKQIEPTEFMVRLSDCGTDTMRAGYKRMKSKNAIILAHRVVKHMVRDFVGEEHAPAVNYFLACSILSGLEFDKKNLLKDIKEIVERIDGGLYELKKTEGKNETEKN